MVLIAEPELIKNFTTARARTLGEVLTEYLQATATDLDTRGQCIETLIFLAEIGIASDKTSFRVPLFDNRLSEYERIFLSAMSKQYGLGQEVNLRMASIYYRAVRSSANPVENLIYCYAKTQLARIAYSEGNFSSAIENLFSAGINNAEPLPLAALLTVQVHEGTHSNHQPFLQTFQKRTTTEWLTLATRNQFPPALEALAYNTPASTKQFELFVRAAEVGSLYSLGKVATRYVRGFAEQSSPEDPGIASNLSLGKQLAETAYAAGDPLALWDYIYYIFARRNIFPDKLSPAKLLLLRHMANYGKSGLSDKYFEIFTNHYPTTADYFFLAPHADLLNRVVAATQFAPAYHELALLSERHALLTPSKRHQHYTQAISYYRAAYALAPQNVSVPYARLLLKQADAIIPGSDCQQEMFHALQTAIVTKAITGEVLSSLIDGCEDEQMQSELRHYQIILKVMRGERNLSYPNDMMAIRIMLVMLFNKQPVLEILQIEANKTAIIDYLTATITELKTPLPKPSPLSEIVRKQWDTLLTLATTRAYFILTLEPAPFTLAQPPQLSTLEHSMMKHLIALLTGEVISENMENDRWFFPSKITPANRKLAATQIEPLFEALKEKYFAPIAAAPIETTRIFIRAP